MSSSSTVLPIASTPATTGADYRAQFAALVAQFPEEADSVGQLHQLDQLLATNTTPAGLDEPSEAVMHKLVSLYARLLECCKRMMKVILQRYSQSQNLSDIFKLMTRDDLNRYVECAFLELELYKVYVEKLRQLRHPAADVAAYRERVDFHLAKAYSQMIRLHDMAHQSGWVELMSRLPAALRDDYFMQEARHRDRVYQNLAISPGEDLFKTNLYAKLANMLVVVKSAISRFDLTLATRELQAAAVINGFFKHFKFDFTKELMPITQALESYSHSGHQVIVTLAQVVRHFADVEFIPVKMDLVPGAHSPAIEAYLAQKAVYEKAGRFDLIPVTHALQAASANVTPDDLTTRAYFACELGHSLLQFRLNAFAFSSFGTAAFLYEKKMAKQTLTRAEQNNFIWIHYAQAAVWAKAGAPSVVPPRPGYPGEVVLINTHATEIINLLKIVHKNLESGFHPLEIANYSVVHGVMQFYKAALEAMICQKRDYREALNFLMHLDKFLTLNPVGVSLQLPAALTECRHKNCKSCANPLARDFFRQAQRMRLNSEKLSHEAKSEDVAPQEVKRTPEQEKQLQLMLTFTREQEALSQALSVIAEKIRQADTVMKDIRLYPVKTGAKKKIDLLQALLPPLKSELAKANQALSLAVKAQKIEALQPVKTALSKLTSQVVVVLEKIMNKQADCVANKKLAEAALEEKQRHAQAQKQKAERLRMEKQEAERLCKERQADNLLQSRVNPLVRNITESFKCAGMLFPFMAVQTHRFPSVQKGGQVAAGEALTQDEVIIPNSPSRGL